MVLCWCVAVRSDTVPPPEQARRGLLRPGSGEAAIVQADGHEAREDVCQEPLRAAAGDQITEEEVSWRLALRGCPSACAPRGTRGCTYGL